ncbi:MAG: hypothetical protein DCC58_05085 [Chloroflexi bacterium]|nr:MAG: hypothetical protein DCC58_05085 [Chloroflexota bacterium]
MSLVEYSSGGRSLVAAEAFAQAKRAGISGRCFSRSIDPVTGQVRITQSRQQRYEELRRSFGRSAPRGDYQRRYCKLRHELDLP